MNKNKNIYLDYNATVPLKEEVAEIMAEVAKLPYNPSSIHSFGREAKKLIEEARNEVAKFSGAENAQVIFTSSGTEANNMAINGIKDISAVIVSSIEHVSVLKPAEDKKAFVIPVDENGVIRLDALRRILENVDGKALVSVMLANNETGVIQPIKEIAELVYRNGGYIHCDAAQALGKIKLNFNDLNVDMMTISAHKLGGPQGAAALIIKKGLVVAPFVKGGGQESGYRAGTENVAAIVGFGKAAELADEIKPDLRDWLESEIKSYAPDAVIFGQNVARLPNTSYIAAGKMPSETQLIAFDLSGVAVSSGSACSSGKVSISHVLLAMGVSKEQAAMAIRVSLGKETTKEEISRFLEIWKKNYDKTKRGYAEAA